MDMLEVRTWMGRPWAMLTSLTLPSEMEAERSRAWMVAEWAL